MKTDAPVRPVLLPQPRTLRLDGATAPQREPGAIVDARLPPQGYRLRIGPDAIELAGGDEAGLSYGRATLAQLARWCGHQGQHGQLPTGVIEDNPDIAVRGVMLDVSRDKVPTMTTLRDLIDRLAGWKVNHLQLYMEHVFAYSNHGEVWAQADPFTADELSELDRLCRDRHVELVPNQNCLGHAERWLAHPRYRPLALAPDGFVDPWGRRRGPSTLDPAHPGSLALVRELLAELLPCFSSSRVHVGLDEPWELPEQRIAEYGEWLGRLRSLPELDGHEMLVWGDILATHPGLLGEVPKGVTVCEWGYEDWHPFDPRVQALAGAGLPFWVCPGTSSWLSVLGRTTNAWDNCERAAAAALGHGAQGYLVTDWGDNGHLQHLPISEPGLAAGAALSWCREANSDLDLAAALSVHAFDDATGVLARALVELGDVHRVVKPQVPNMSVLTLHLYAPRIRLGRRLTEGLTPEDLLEVERRIDAAVAALDRSRPKREDGELVLDEVRAGAGLVRLLCRDGRARLDGDGRLAAVPEKERAELAATLEPMIDEYRRLWLARNRPGGLSDSASWLERLLRAYRTGEVEPA